MNEQELLKRRIHDENNKKQIELTKVELAERANARKKLEERPAT